MRAIGASAAATSIWRYRILYRIRETRLYDAAIAAGRRYLAPLLTGAYMNSEAVSASPATLNPTGCLSHPAIRLSRG